MHDIHHHEYLREKARQPILNKDWKSYHAARNQLTKNIKQVKHVYKDK